MNSLGLMPVNDIYFACSSSRYSIAYSSLILGNDNEIIKFNYDVDAFDRILKKLNKEGFYTDELGEICSELFVSGFLEQVPDALKKYYFLNPHRLCEIIENNPDMFYKLGYHYKLPQQAYSDQSSFDFFVKVLIERNTENADYISILGEILGKSCNGSDDIFPHEYVRMVMENYREYQLPEKIAFGKLYSQGLHSVGDGSRESQISKKYRDEAKFFDIDYPETAKLLRFLSSLYESTAKQDHIYSEIGVW